MHHAPYAEFTAKVQQKQAELDRQGVATIRVYLRMDEFVPWCRANGRKIDANARAEFAAFKARDQDNG